ncbi:hypothetical protein ONS95_014196 [Cadophora gregata]|uniref:uncharacterized protein n=1 Tax=Cadophora gregata TaxID=51156 RepID=UPI0026DACA06|nr:uncharacterized protein ONS95_014196 [Cadophora gregata]KAK0113951.1 hypothetical protein ONS96_014800 [Cadophora gregata f. sp. sojae]KAK0114712.1 hypothetical protein ONS95_014196 [Cadophora gregata]
MAPTPVALVAPSGVTPNFSQPKDVLHTVNYVIQSICLFLVTVMVVVRVYTRVMVQKVMYKEDWACIVSWCFCVLYITDNFLFNVFGGGYHQWDVSPQDAIDFQKVSYGGLLVYGPTAFFIKVTILLFFARLYEAAFKTTLGIKILILLMLGFYVPMGFAKVFICSPIAAYWDAAGYPDATCLDVKTLYLADTTVSVITDFAVLTTPVPLIWGMNLPKVKKLRVIASLAAGGIACVATVARLVLLAMIIDSHDVTLNTVALNLLAIAEVSIGLICACLPSLVVFCKHISKTCSQEKVKKSDHNIQMVNVGSSGKPIIRKGTFDDSMLRWTYVEVEADS